MLQHRALNSKELTRLLNNIYEYDSSKGEFLLPIVNTKKRPLSLIKNLFDGTSFLLKSVNVEKMEKNCYVLVVKGKKQKTVV